MITHMKQIRKQYENISNKYEAIRTHTNKNTKNVNKYETIRTNTKQIRKHTKQIRTNTQQYEKL